MFKNIYTTRMSENAKALGRRFDKITSRPVKFKRLIAFACMVMLTAVCTFSTLAVANVANDNTDYVLDITHNGEVIELENKPFVENGEVYVPLRELFEKLGFMDHSEAKINWDDGVVLIYLVEKNLNEDAASAYTSYSYKIEIGKEELIINPDELSAMSKSYEFVEPMNLPPVLKNSTTYVPFAYAERMVERADNGIQSPPERYNLDFIYSGEVLSVLYPFDTWWKVTSVFGERIHPVTGEKTMHNGVDIGADEGEAVKAGIDGMVIENGFDEEYGNYVILKNDIGVEILYANLAMITRRDVYEVEKGDIIGTSGNTGKSAGPHLHVEVKINGKYVNPELYFMAVFENSEIRMIYD